MRVHAKRMKSVSGPHVRVMHFREHSSRSCDLVLTYVCTSDCIDALISVMHCASRVVCTHAYDAKYRLGRMRKAIDGSSIWITRNKQNIAAADADCPSRHEFSPWCSKHLFQVKPTAPLWMQSTLDKPQANALLCVNMSFLSLASDAAVRAPYSRQSTMPSLAHYDFIIYAIMCIMT